MTPVNNRKPMKQGNFALSVKTKLLVKGWTVTKLAHEIGRARGTVSVAIHHDSMMPGVREQIRKTLNL